MSLDGQAKALAALARTIMAPLPPPERGRSLQSAAHGVRARANVKLSEIAQRIVDRGRHPSETATGEQK